MTRHSLIIIAWLTVIGVAACRTHKHVLDIADTQSYCYSISDISALVVDTIDFQDIIVRDSDTIISTTKRLLHRRTATVQAHQRDTIAAHQRQEVTKTTTTDPSIIPSSETHEWIYMLILGVILCLIFARVQPKRD